MYWCIDHRTGAKLSVLFLFSAYLNDAAKAVAGQPRPFEYDPRVRALASAGGGGFPSGHAQHAVVIWGYLASRFGAPWVWVAAGLLIFVISLSRIYLGVHFPTDLPGGWLLGVMLLLIYNWVEPMIVARMMKKGISGQVCFALAIPAFLIVVTPAGTKSGLTAAAALMGMGVGMVLERRWVGFQAGGPWWKRFVRLVIGMAVSVVLWEGLRSAFASLEPQSVFRLVRYGLLGLWASLGAPWIFHRLKLVEAGISLHAGCGGLQPEEKKDGNSL